MIRRLSVLLAASVLVAGAASADVSVRQSKKLCVAAAAQQLQPAPTKVRVRENEVTMIGNVIRNVLAVTMPDGAKGKATCDVDTATAEVKVAMIQS